MLRRLSAALAVTVVFVVAAQADDRRGEAEKVLSTWYHMTLELVRHTPTYTPPVASRTLAYMGVASYEAVASGDPAHMRSLAGQLNGLSALPARDPALTYDDAVVLDVVLGALVRDLFANTGPTGHHAMASLTAKLDAEAAAGLTPAVVKASGAYGQSLAAAILAWSLNDGGAVIDNMGFPRAYTLNPDPGHWLPTSKIVLQQAPLLPDWGKNRPFAMTAGACPLPPPPAYSEAKTSDFYKTAMEVYDTSRALTDEKKLIARFWSDDAMLSYTPAGHWIAILDQVAAERGLALEDHVDALARIGVAMADAFIGAWQAKYQYDLIRPISYIRKVIDPKWDSLLTTPPFPEYPSGHSAQSAAAAEVLTALFGDAYQFTDESPTPDGSPQRSFASFRAAADEAAMSRLYGGIHFLPAIEQGQAQGRCIAAFAIALKTRG